MWSMAPAGSRDARAEARPSRAAIHMISLSVTMAMSSPSRPRAPRVGQLACRTAATPGEIAITARRCLRSTAVSDAEPCEPDLWLREARTTVAADDRARRHWLTQQAAEAATLRGVLRDAAERGARLAVHGQTGATWTGDALSVGDDVLALRTQGGATLLVRLDVVFAVRVEGTAAPAGDRHSPIELTMHQALATAVLDRPRVQLSCAEAASVRGMLTEVGDELARVRLDSGETIVVVLDAIATALVQ